MSDQTTAASLAERLLSIADEIDEARADAIADGDTWVATQYLVESLQAAERAVRRLRDEP